VADTVRCVPIPETGTVFAGTGAVWELLTHGIPVPNPREGEGEGEGEGKGF
jgi:hypothetical protein